MEINVIPLYTFDGKLHPCNVVLYFDKIQIKLSWEEFCEFELQMIEVRKKIDNDISVIEKSIAGG